MTVLKLSGCSQPWREWKRVGRFVFGQFNQWSFPSICQWPSFCKSYFSIPLLPLFYQSAWAWPVCKRRYLQAFPFRRTGLALCRGGTCKRFLSEEQVSRSAFLFTLVLRLNANRNYTFCWYKVSKTYRLLNSNKLMNFPGDLFSQLVKLQWL